MTTEDDEEIPEMEWDGVSERLVLVANKPVDGRKASTEEASVYNGANATFSETLSASATLHLCRPNLEKPPPLSLQHPAQ